MKFVLLKSTGNRMQDTFESVNETSHGGRLVGFILDVFIFEFYRLILINHSIVPLISAPFIPITCALFHADEGL